MKCEKCGSDNVQRLQVTYEGGTHNIEMEGTADGGGDGHGSQYITSSGKSSTLLAERVAPPEKQSYVLMSLILVFISFFCLGAESWMWNVLGIGLIGLMVFWAHGSIKYNRNVWPKDYKIWMESWICHKCGNIFHHPL
jgi:hypothetical protein